MDFFIFEGGFGIARSHSINIYPWEILNKLAIYRDRNGNLRQAQLHLTRHETLTVTNFENSGGALEQIRDHSAGKLPVVESPWRFYHLFAVQLIFIPLCTLAGFLIGSLLQ